MPLTAHFANPWTRFTNEVPHWAETRRMQW